MSNCTSLVNLDRRPGPPEHSSGGAAATGMQVR